MDHQIVPIIANIIHVPPSFFQNFFLYMWSAISEVIANSSIIKEDDIFVLDACDFLIVILKIDLLLANGFGEDFVSFFSEISGNDVHT